MSAGQAVWRIFKWCASIYLVLVVLALANSLYHP